MEIKESLRLPRRISDNLKTLIKIVETVHKSTDLKEIYDTALDLVTELEKVDMAAIYLVDETSNEAVLQAQRNFPDDYVEQASRITRPVGITWKIIDSGRALNIDDVKNNGDVGPAGLKAGYNGILGVPVLLDGKAIGVIWFARYSNEKFTTREVELLSTIGNQIAIAIARVKQNQELEERNKHLSLLSKVTEKVHASADLKLIYKTFLEAVEEISLFELMSLYLVEETGTKKEAVLQIHRNLPPEYKEKATRIPHPKGATWKVINSGEALSYSIYDKKNPLGPAGRSLGKRSVLSIPLQYRGRTIGVIHFMSAVNKAYEKQQIDFLSSLGNQIGTAIAKAMMFEEANERAEEMERLYENLQATQDQLIQTEKLASLGQLVSSIAHEINNPLTPILGYSQLLMSHAETDPVKVQRFYEVINQSADKVKKIVENLLSFGRRDAPRRDYQDVNNILERAVEFREHQLGLNNITVAKDFDDGIPKTMVDPGQLQQVFNNITLNAYHAMSASGVQGGRLEVRTSCADGENIEILFSDSGPGIRKEIIGKIFDPFFTTKAPGVGTGLGLSVSYGIIKEHGGDIRVESEEGKGARFTVRIPVRDYRDYMAVAEHDEQATAESGDDNAPSDSVKRVLIVEDDELITALMKGVLEGEGFMVDLSTDGEQALEMIDGKAYNFIICDIKMPNMDGREFYRRLSGRNSGIAGRILFITGDPSEETLDFISKTGNRFLSKPFKVNEFKEAVSEVF